MLRTRRPHRGNTRAPLIAAAIATACCPALLHAREGHLVAGSTSAWVEIQGATRPILAPGSTFTYAYLPFNNGFLSTTALDGIATDGASAYFLVTMPNFATRTTSDAIWTYNLATGARTATTTIQRPTGDPGLSDIALLSGTLYAVSGPTSTTFPASGTTRVYAVSSTGALTGVYSRTDTSAATPQIAANSQSNRVVVLPVGGASAGPFTSTPQVLLNPSAWTVSQSVAGTSAGQISFNLDGSRLTEYSTSGSLASAKTYAVPGFTPVSPQPSAFGQAGPAFANAVSDAFDYAYPPTAPAVVELYSNEQPYLPLFRTGQHTFQVSAGIGNYAAPDATTVDQVAATNVTWSQTSGPAVQTSTTLSSAGPLATNRTLSTTTFTVDATGATRGAYIMHGAATVQGQYTTSGSQPDSRPVAVENTNLIAGFAIDPASSNYVGNGDGEIGPYGWSGFGPSNNYKTSSLALYLLPSGPFAHSSQVLELGTPSSPMLLSFDYNVNQSEPGTADLTVTLGGIPVAFVPGVTDASGVGHFSAYLTDPRLQGLSNPTLDFQVADEGMTYASLFVDNISLVAVPEPATAIGVVGMLPTFLRRRPRVAP